LTAEVKGFNVARRIFMVPDDESLFIALNKSMGVLLVTSSPNGCTITVDGQKRGQTPATLHLPVGSHRVSVGNGSRANEETVEIQSDGFDARRFSCQQ
jgi:hypothetical protein